MLRFTLTAVLLSTASIPAQIPGLQTLLTLTNDATDNEVQIGARLFGWMLPLGRYSTGGTGTGAGLGSQGALAVTDDGSRVLAVNPGSDDVTLFWSVAGLFLLRSDIAPTGGTRPTSVDVHGDLVYALNADSDEVTGFRIVGNSLNQIGKYPLSGTGVAAAQVGIAPSGRHVVVTERGTDQILVFPVQMDGSLGTATVNASAAPTPFGFVFRDDGTLAVSEAAGGQAGQSATSTYAIGGNGTLATISAAVPTNQTAACWVAIPRGGRFAYTTNTGSASITGYGLDRRGALRLLQRSGVSGSLRSGASPIDFDFDRSGRLLFVLDSTHDEIVTFFRGGRGQLFLLPGSLPLPDGAAGVIAR